MTDPSPHLLILGPQSRKEASETHKDEDATDYVYTPFDLHCHEEISPSNKPGEDGLTEDEKAPLDTREDAILMGIATPVPVAVKPDEEGLLESNGAERSNGLTEHGNGNVHIKEEDGEYLNGSQR